MKTKFEEWVNNIGLSINLAKNKNGEYKNKSTQQYFLAWTSGYNEALNSTPSQSGNSSLLYSGERRNYLCSLGDLKIPEGTEIKGVKLEGFGSWRGSYNEPCLFITADCNSKITHQELEEVRQSLLTDTFYGYKGGEYRYSENSDVNVERSRKDYSNCEHLNDLMKYTNLGLFFKG